MSGMGSEYQRVLSEGAEGLTSLPDGLERVQLFDTLFVLLLCRGYRAMLYTALF